MTERIDLPQEKTLREYLSVGIKGIFKPFEEKCKNITHTGMNFKDFS